MSYADRVREMLDTARRHQALLLQQVWDHHDCYQEILGLNDLDIEELFRIRNGEPFLSPEVGNIKIALGVEYLPANIWSRNPNNKFEFRLVARCITKQKKTTSQGNIHGHDYLRNASYLSDYWHRRFFNALKRGPRPDHPEQPGCLQSEPLEVEVESIIAKQTA